MVIEGGCGSDVCAARVQVRLLLPDDGVFPPCDLCIAAMGRGRGERALAPVPRDRREGDDLALSLASALCHVGAL